MIERSSPYAVLAAILTSRKVGLSHVRLVGEVVVAQARLNQWLFDKGKASLPADAWVGMTERVLECEDRYKAAWEEVCEAEIISSHDERLRRLEVALRDAVVTLTSLQEELDQPGE